jgi:ATP-dependent DNA helicase RecG
VRVDFGINFGLNETQCKIVELMIANLEVTAEQIAETIGITKRQIEANISKLKALGIVERKGARKKGRWVIKQKK